MSSVTKKMLARVAGCGSLVVMKSRTITLWSSPGALVPFGITSSLIVNSALEPVCLTAAIAFWIASAASSLA